MYPNGSIGYTKRLFVYFLLAKLLFSLNGVVIDSIAEETTPHLKRSIQKRNGAIDFNSLLPWKC